MSDTPIGPLPSGTAIRLSLPLVRLENRVLEGVIRGQEGTTLLVSLDWGDLSWSLVDKDKTWLLVHEQGEDIVTHQVGFLELRNDRTLCLSLLSATSFNAARAAERIEAEVLLRDWPLGSPWSRLRKTTRQKVVLSRNGILFTTEIPLRLGHEIGLEIVLPGRSQQPVQVAGHVVHATSKPGHLYEVAVAFKSIAREDQDLIDTLFLTRHFRKMHDRVRLFGSVFSPTLDAPQDDNDPQEPH
jgi:PilZ domain